MSSRNGEAKSVEDYLDLDKMPESLKAFWLWCADHSIRSKPLIITDRPPMPDGDEGFTLAANPDAGRENPEVVKRFAGPVRGIFAGEALKAGAVVAVVPWKACLSAQTVSRKLLPKHMTSPMRTAMALRRWGGAHPYESQYLWLAALVASLQILPPEQNPWHPYTSLFPRSFALHDAAVKHYYPYLPQEEQISFDDAKKVGQRHVSALHRTTAAIAKKRHLSGNIPSTFALEWGYRTVLSRAVALPSGCTASSPFPVEEYLTRNEGTPVIPAMIPIVDLFNSPYDPAEPPNCEVFTCVDKTSVEARFFEGKSKTEEEELARLPPQRIKELVQRYKDDPANVLPGDRCVVVCTRNQVDLGEELTLSYDIDDVGVTLFRHGFLNPPPPPSLQEPVLDAQQDQGEDVLGHLETRMMPTITGSGGDDNANGSPQHGGKKPERG